MLTRDYLVSKIFIPVDCLGRSCFYSVFPCKLENFIPSVSLSLYLLDLGDRRYKRNRKFCSLHWFNTAMNWLCSLANKNNLYLWSGQTLRSGSELSGKEMDRVHVTITQRPLEQLVCGCMEAWKVYRPGTIFGDGALVCNVWSSSFASALFRCFSLQTSLLYKVSGWLTLFSFISSEPLVV